MKRELVDTFCNLRFTFQSVIQAMSRLEDEKKRNTHRKLIRRVIFPSDERRFRIKKEITVRCRRERLYTLTLHT